MMTALCFIHTVISLMEKLIDIKGITVIFSAVCTAFSNEEAERFVEAAGKVREYLGLE